MVFIFCHKNEKAVSGSSIDFVLAFTSSLIYKRSVLSRPFVRSPGALSYTTFVCFLYRNIASSKIDGGCWLTAPIK